MTVQRQWLVSRWETKTKKNKKKKNLQGEIEMEEI